MARSVVQMLRMEPSIKTAVQHAALHVTMVFTNPAVAVFRTIVQVVKRHVQTLERQVKSRPVTAANGAMRKPVPTTILAIKPEQTVAAASMVQSNVMISCHRHVQQAHGLTKRRAARRQTEPPNALETAFAAIRAIMAITTLVAAVNRMNAQMAQSVVMV